MLYLMIALILLAGLLFYSFIIEPRRLKERHYLFTKNKRTVLDISEAFDLYAEQEHVVIAHISDLHFSRWFKPKRMNKIIRSTIENKPDLIVFTGDLIDDYKKWPRQSTSRLVEKLKKLSAPMGKVAVLGNHDYRSDGQYFVKEVLESADFTVLTNEMLFGSNNKISMSIAGVDSEEKKPQYNYAPTLAEWQLLLIHQPDLVSRVDNIQEYDLVLAGHSHGGQIRLPFFKGRTVGALVYSDGLYLLAKNTLLSISNGIGTTLIPARLGVPPEITYYHLDNRTAEQLENDLKKAQQEKEGKAKEQ